MEYLDREARQNAGNGWGAQEQAYVNAVQGNPWGGSNYYNASMDLHNRQQAIEWANQQRMSDPSYWANAFGLASGGSWNTPYQYSYEDTAAPYYARLNALLDNPDSIANTGAYKFAFKQGNEAINRNLAAKGLLKSGNRLSALTEFGQGLASQQYGAEVDRLAGIAQGRRTGDIGKYQADTGRYSADVQGQNQLKAILMNSMMDRQKRYMAPGEHQVGGSMVYRWD